MTTCAAVWTQSPQPCANVNLNLNALAQKDVGMALGPLELLLILIPLAIYIGLIAGVIYLIVQVARNSNDIKQNSQDIAYLLEAQKNGPSAGQGPHS